MTAEAGINRARPRLDVTERAAVVVGGDGAEADEPAASSPRCDSSGPGPEDLFDREASPPDEEADEEAAREKNQRLAADQELVNELAADNFAGSLYDRFTDQLTRYALGVLPALISSGEIFQRVAARGFDLKPSSEEIAELRRDAGTRQSLAGATVANALPWFRDHALVKGGWSAARGACLTTYFVGACDFYFPNQMRAWRREQQHTQHLLRADQDLVLLAGADDTVPGPEAAAIGNLWVNERIGDADDRIRMILFLKINGYSYEEIAEACGGTISVRAVEGLVYRWRKKLQIELRKGESDERQ